MLTKLQQYKPDEITQLISQASEGDDDALDQLIPIVYSDLKRIASGLRHKQMQVSRTLNTTSLVNEAWLKLNKYGIRAESRKHFFCIIAKAMRQILVNAAKEKQCLKRNAQREEGFDISDIALDSQAEWMLQLDEIIDSIEQSHGRLAEVFQLKYFLGFTEIEVAETLDVHVRTIRRDWLTVRKIIQEIIE